MFTGRLGQLDSRLGQFRLSERGSLVFQQPIQQGIALLDTVALGVLAAASSTLELAAFLTHGHSGTGESTMPFTSRLGQSDSRLGQFQLSQLPSGGSGVFEESLQNNMVLGQSVVVFTLTPRLTDDLGLISASTVENFAVQFPSSALALAQSATQAGPINRTATSTLALTSAAVAEGYVVASSALILTSTAPLNNGVPIYRSASSTLALTQPADPGFIPIKQVTSILALVQSTADTGIPKSASASSALVVVQDAYSNIKNLTASNTLTVTDTSYAGQPVNASAETTFELTEDGRSGIIVVSLADVLGLTQEAIGDTNIQRREVAQALALAQAITTALVHNQTVVQPLGLTDIAVKNQIAVTASSTLVLSSAARTAYQRSITSTLSLVSAVTKVSPIYLAASNALVLQDSNNVARPWYADTASFLTIAEVIGGDPDTGEPIYGTITGLQQSVDVHFGIANVSVTSLISFAQMMGQTKQAFGDNTLELVDSAEVAYGYVADLLELVQTILAEVGKSGTNTLAVSQTLSFQVDRSPTPSNTLSLGQTAAHALGPDLCNYSPFGPLPSAPTLGSATLTLTYPFTTPSLTLALRNPEFNNVERLSLTRISRITRGGTLVVFADTIWPKVKSLTLKIKVLTDTQRVDLLNFLDSSVGKEIGLLDHENRQWRGVILNPNTPLIQQHNCNHEVDLEFEGELV